MTNRIPTLLAIFLLLLASSASGFKMEGADFEYPTYTYNSGGSGGGGSPAPNGSMPLPQGENKTWIDGWWYVDAQGFDPTIKYDERSKDTGAALAKLGSDNNTIAIAEDLMRYHFGWAHASFRLETDLVAGIPNPINGPPQVASVQFQPGVGWFPGLDGNPEDYPGSVAEVGDTINWTPHENEAIYVEITSDDVGCHEYEVQNILSNSSPNAPLQVESKDIGSYNGQGYRADKLNLYIKIDPAAIDCTYSIQVDWSLQFVFEALAPTPDSALPDPFAVDPNEYEDAEDFFQSGFFLGIRDYPTVATFSATANEFKMENGFHTTQAVHDPAQSGEDAKDFPMSVFYAPILPVDYVCGTLSLGICVPDTMSAAPDAALSLYITESIDVAGVSIVAVERWQGNAAATVHTINPNDVLDLNESVVYKQPAQGNTTTVPFLSA